MVVDLPAPFDDPVILLAHVADFKGVPGVQRLTSRDEGRKTEDGGRNRKPGIRIPVLSTSIRLARFLFRVTL
jgi:hypothetical protein